MMTFLTRRRIVIFIKQKILNQFYINILIYYFTWRKQTKKRVVTRSSNNNKSKLNFLEKKILSFYFINLFFIL